MIRAALFAVLFPVSAVGQTTAADILAALEKPTTELEQLTSILDGPDEEKSLVAMRLMLTSGDASMERLAFRSGSTSTNSIMGGVALEAYVQSQPTLMAFASIEDDAEIEGFQRWIQREGSLSSDRTGTFPITIGPKIDGENCFGSSDRKTSCRNRIGGTELSFYIGDAWGTASLNDSGELVGRISNGSYSTGPITLTIPLLGQLQ